ncbi:hypothetical protein [Caloranaerobacter azorensis]|uniref:Uncharacterized protein n=1 Tax=Caloranaerobacter azorensis TaxID=116090 RepID=A0A6P1YFD4_9FIRM|nr:hypothetical protein [Caloranaerobacter azorensis]QIB28010.1 hypothetical protein G3A45_12435 [Caloranaerobacter azorensis]
MKITLKTILSLIAENLIIAEIFLTIDDTLQVKFGKRFDYHDKLFDHTNKTCNSYLDGYCFDSVKIKK